MKIKIELDDEGRIVGDEARLLASINAALDDVNGRATAFTVCDATDVIQIARNAEEYLETHNVTYSDRWGARASYKPAGPSANAYKNAAISTMIVLTRGRRGQAVWYLEEVVRTEVWPRNPERFNVMITDSAARNLVKRTLAAFGRKEVPLEGLQAAA